MTTHPTDAELMQSVDWLGSPEAGLKLPVEFLSPVSDAIKLARKQEKRIGELEAERNEARAQSNVHLLESAEMNDRRLDAEQALTAERQRREECEAALRPFASPPPQLENGRTYQITTMTTTHHDPFANARALLLPLSIRVRPPHEGGGMTRLDFLATAMFGAGVLMAVLMLAAM